MHGLKFSVATTDFHHSNFTETTYKISVDQEESKCWLIFIEDCHTLQPMVSLTVCAHLTNDGVVTHTGRDLNMERH